jgi:tetratricopeptide (TPR) repeat protein
VSGSYGRSFASKLIQDGKYAEAVEAATKAIAAEEEDPEHRLDRATALVELSRPAEALADFESALALDEAANVLETDFVDDAYFSALLEVARAEAVTDGVARLAHYLEVLPDGRHKKDVTDWQKRLRGELPSEFVKRRVEDVRD